MPTFTQIGKNDKVILFSLSSAGVGKRDTDGCDLFIPSEGVRGFEADAKRIRVWGRFAMQQVLIPNATLDFDRIPAALADLCIPEGRWRLWRQLEVLGGTLCLAAVLGLEFASTTPRADVLAGWLLLSLSLWLAVRVWQSRQWPGMLHVAGCAIAALNLIGFASHSKTIEGWTLLASFLLVALLLTGCVAYNSGYLLHRRDPRMPL